MSDNSNGRAELGQLAQNIRRLTAVHEERCVAVEEAVEFIKSRLRRVQTTSKKLKNAAGALYAACVENGVDDVVDLTRMEEEQDIRGVHVGASASAAEEARVEVGEDGVSKEEEAAEEATASTKEDAKSGAKQLAEKTAPVRDNGAAALAAAAMTDMDQEHPASPGVLEPVGAPPATYSPSPASANLDGDGPSAVPATKAASKSAKPKETPKKIDKGRTKNSGTVASGRVTKEHAPHPKMGNEVNGEGPRQEGTRGGGSKKEKDGKGKRTVSEDEN